MKLQYLLFVFLILFSCNSEEKEREQENDNERADQKSNYTNMIKQYSATVLDQKSLVRKFSFELENDLLGNNIGCVANIFDIKKIKNQQYVLIAKGDNLSLELKLNQITLDEILEYRSKLSKKGGLFKYFGFSGTAFLFIIKPIALSKRYGIDKTITDYDIIESESDYDDRSSSTEVELIDYTIELELTNNGFHIKAECVDLTLVDEIYWDLEE